MRSIHQKIVALSGFAMVALFCVSAATLADIPRSLSSAPPLNDAGTADTASEKPLFDRPGLHKLRDGAYEADFATDVARFYPATMTIPTGSKVTFFVTSPKIVRDFTVAELPVYMEAGPGWERPATHVFDQASTYLLVCSEHCGLEHMDMHAVIAVK